MAKAERDNPRLWEEVKDEITQGSKGGRKGQWSARKAQMAVQEYKRRGGTYNDSGPAQDETHLHEWTEEEWGTKSGGKSGETGERYLPKKVRMILTEDEYDRSTVKKKSGKQQFVKQPKDVAKKAARIRKDGPTKEMLLERAKDLGIEGRSDMGKKKLLGAIEDATDKNGRAKDSRAHFDAMKKDKLKKKAKKADIKGRSDMSKTQLVKALASR
ncbi:aspartate-semialdehyde dehydrogenase [Pseudoroseicyclus tamaricis]|uniref:Aspartate-semialdehyde dehydrogenase n=1 Tax=Pseudoroseicyclus tamaricis TaxID=2705421 RepID=A0A6B2JM55_9RHOB|nr:aspartate-semialdehyde dehydrogenase [Pseudoroseicyclus tamaricis]NDV02661.1 aspartate-semialdehyde dehydrogenase [Pseudoroseicyclus tamaricis]